MKRLAMIVALCFGVCVEAKTAPEKLIPGEAFLIKEAITNFKQAKEESDGHIQRITCKFKHDKVIIKTHYKDYHKKSTCQVENYDGSALGISDDITIEAIWDTDKPKQSMALVRREKGERRDEKRVILPENVLSM